MNEGASIRRRVRRELTQAIEDTARAHLARSGPAGLSLRAVARDLGMASSALYRYFPTRDHLLTRLIVSTYDAIGAAAEAAEPGGPGSYRPRWLAVARAVRRWGQEHPHEWALVYGSPVPGYVAPEDTVIPAGRVALVLVSVAAEAAGAGALRPAGGPPIPESLQADARALQAATGSDLAEEVLLAGLVAWTQLYGTVSFELFGHYRGVVSDLDAYFDYATAAVMDLVGLDPGA